MRPTALSPQCPALLVSETASVCRLTASQHCVQYRHHMVAQLLHALPLNPT